MYHGENNRFVPTFDALEGREMMAAHVLAAVPAPPRPTVADAAPVQQRVLVHEQLKVDDHAAEPARAGGKALANDPAAGGKGFVIDDAVWSRGLAMNIGPTPQAPADAKQPAVGLMSLVGTTNVFTIENGTTNVNISFSIRWSPTSAWQSYTIAPGQARRFWHPTDTNAEIQFDKSLSPGYQAKQYTLTTKGEIEGANGPAGNGQRYVFRPTYGLNQAVNGVELYKRV